MHEYGIAYDIVETARRAAIEHHARLISKVCVDVGEISMINPEQVEFLFATIIEDDPLFAGTVLTCTVIPPVTRCDCGYVGSEIYVCPDCGALPSIEKGKEIVVTNIEIEADEE
ncbi:MAG: hydrogenase maturation nickel metallochaperone HypA [Methanospirillum sp.]|uniref:hydrogenase maturation nickel metallochaperone HypA/HybF n=1 Tax=Methanospirillum sp. TaxID=45200 RepID=UPI00237582B1|nr:hydrogenase maturation nickel metallochaperone HypA [Methanospirillum sp.]MDD1728732.1 hydrogenase maturation nickel metallochaperone HypA [Methanospirillum sp.]